MSVLRPYVIFPSFDANKHYKIQKLYFVNKKLLTNNKGPSRYTGRRTSLLLFSGHCGKPQIKS
jgi:hypothetical protein